MNRLESELSELGVDVDVKKMKNLQGAAARAPLGKNIRVVRSPSLSANRPAPRDELGIPDEKVCIHIFLHQMLTYFNFRKELRLCYFAIKPSVVYAEKHVKERPIDMFTISNRSTCFLVNVEWEKLIGVNYKRCCYSYLFITLFVVVVNRYFTINPCYVNQCNSNK